MVNKPSYVLVTPAKDESTVIVHVLESVCRQTILPRKWVIVNDGSDEKTSEIVSEYGSTYPFITLLNIKSDLPGFASKARAFNIGVSEISGIEYDFLGNIDADMSFEPNYFESIFTLFRADDKLGIAGGQVLELVNGDFRPRIHSKYSVAGALQLFRKECFETVKGYRELQYGGIDTVAEVFAEMSGWKVRTFDSISAKHHRPVGTSSQSMYKSKVKYGIKERALGSYPPYVLLKSIRRIMERPILIGSALFLYGYIKAFRELGPYDLPEEFYKFRQAKQKKRLFFWLGSDFFNKKRATDG